MTAHRPILFFIAFFVFLTGAVFSAHAQSFLDLSSAQTTFTMSLDPQIPPPYSQATVNFTSTAMNLQNAQLSLTQNGKSVYKGAVQPVTVTVGAAGSLTSLKATITSEGATDTETLTLRPESVDLVLEPLSSVPPLYSGKALPAIDGSVRAVAVANFVNSAGKALDPSTLSYTWTIGGALYAAGSGIGKSVAIVTSPLQYRAADVSVTVQTQDGTYVGSASTNISVQSPSIRLYRNDPLLGIIFDQTLPDSYTISGAESTLYAAPFSFPLDSGAPTIEWFLNNQSVQTGNSITLRPSGSGTGSAALSLTASDGNSATAVASLSLTFGQAASGNLFGL